MQKLNLNQFKNTLRSIYKDSQRYRSTLQKSREELLEFRRV